MANKYKKKIFSRCFFFLYQYDKKMLRRKVVIINDYISSYEMKIKAMRGGIDERNATGQKVLCQTRMMETVNNSRNRVDMNELKCNQI